MNRDEIKNSSNSSNLQKDKLFQFPVNNTAPAPAPAPAPVPIANINESGTDYSFKQQQQQQQFQQQINNKAIGDQQSKEELKVEKKDDWNRADL